MVAQQRLGGMNPWFLKGMTNPKRMNSVMNNAAITNPPANRILMLDDDADLRAMLQRYLQQHGFTVRAVAEAEQVQRLLTREAFDVLVLDLSMPDIDGLQVCRNLRAVGETIPILMLTARGDPVDRIIGLEMGADDYLPKPFDPRELVARLRVLLRRQNLYGSGTRHVVNFGSWSFNMLTRVLTQRGQPVKLTSGECALLSTLAAQAGRPLGRERLIALTYGTEHDSSDRSIDVQILRLRRLLEDNPASPRYLQTVRGVGYVFTPDGILR